ncbi:CBS domain-containing protein [Streptomyces sp. NBC_01267]|uniref:CBS domain-containing protein n=1 Tax=unclassified Streptomyces TaxID=2593676 RepID=UPI00224EECA7|nr:MULTISPECIES: CBS domain-containing protein [unclassified Streptomyces]MCX4553487.1 CBS domain-containing protein [Streptomyces sp. NBC_01500]WSC18443.1 CBS domain-containing protein [Streptomyces sp. NBC_01766]WSV52483.1 CBS domain-containing protein [Streptomyces sp. NBC_01014]
MRFRTAGDVMTGDVVSVGCATPADDAARSLMEHGIGGLPVVDDDDRVVGVVSRTDLTRYRAGPGSSGSRCLMTLPGRYTSGELMSAPAVTIRAIDTVALTGRTMARRGIGRLPVVDEEARLIGIITRRDLLRVFVRPDSDLRDEILDGVMARALFLHTAPIVSVQDGVVTLSGHLEQDTDRSVAVRMAARVDGVVAVVDRLTGQRAHASE